MYFSKRLKNSLIVFFSVFSVFLSFSCSNFLSSSKLKEEIEKSIDYHKSQDIEILIAADKNQVTTVPYGTITKKVGFEFDIKLVESGNIKFNNWIAINSETGTVYDKEVVFEDSSLLSTKVKVIEKVENLWIKPLCLEIPSVTNFIPSYTPEGKNQDSNIFIDFNTPVKAEDFNNTFKNIQIIADGVDLLAADNCYFELPHLSEDGKRLTIKTIKDKRIIPSESSDYYKLVIVTLKTKGLVNKENTAFDNDLSFEYRINKNVDSVIPELKEFKVYKTKNLDGTYTDELTLADIDTWTQVQFEQNHVKNNFYVYIKARDAGDGLYSAELKEKQLFFAQGGESTFQTNYLPTNAIFTQVEDDYYETYFEYTLTPTYDGIERIDITIFDYAGHLVNLQPFYAIKDTTVVSDRWRLTNSRKAKPVNAEDDRFSTSIYWNSIEDVYATYNGISYTTKMEDLTVAVAYGTDRNNMPQRWLSSSEISYGNHDFYYKDTFDIKKEVLYSGSYDITYEDVNKETLINFTVTDTLGNSLTESYSIPPMKRFTSNYFEVINGNYWTYYIAEPCQADTKVFYISYDEREKEEAINGRPVISDHGEKDPQYLQIMYSYKGSPNFTAFFSPWSDVYNYQLKSTPASPSFTCAIEFDKPIIDSKYCYKISLDKNLYDPSFKYLLTSAYNNNVQIYMNFREESDEMVFYFYNYMNSVNDIVYYAYVINELDSTPRIEVRAGNYQEVDKTGPGLGIDDFYSSAGGSFPLYYSCDSSGFKPYESNPDFTLIEYFYVPYLPVYDYIPLKLTDSEKKSYKHTKCLIPITGNYLVDDENKIYVYLDPKDLCDNQKYLLYAKSCDSLGNYSYSEIEVYFYPPKEKHAFTFVENDEGTKANISVNIKEEENKQSYSIIYEEFDSTNQCWDIPNYGEEIMSETDNGYSGEFEAETNKYIRFSVNAYEELEEWGAFSMQSIPTYLYTKKAVKCNVKNILTGAGGATILCDQPCLYYICTSDVGYGNDLDKWESYGAKIGYTQVSSSNNVDTSLVQPGDKYVVIAHFADNTTLISSVMER